MTNEATNSPMMIPLFQEYSTPPHCKARRNMIAVGANRARPGRSRERILARADPLTAVSAVRSGMWMRYRITSTIPPTGRLI